MLPIGMVRGGHNNTTTEPIALSMCLAGLRRFGEFSAELFEQ